MNADSYYLAAPGGQQAGPYTFAQLRAMWFDGRMGADTMYWWSGATAWEPVAHLKPALEAAPHTALAPPAYATPYAPVYQPLFVRPPKSRGTFIILGLFLGGLGIHNFYAGHNGRGTAQLLITVFLAWVGIGILINFVWIIADLVSVKVDGYGVPMS